MNFISTVGGGGRILCPLNNYLHSPRIFRPSYGPVNICHGYKLQLNSSYPILTCLTKLLAISQQVGHKIDTQKQVCLGQINRFVVRRTGTRKKIIIACLGCLVLFCAHNSFTAPLVLRVFEAYRNFFLLNLPSHFCTGLLDSQL